MTLNLESSIVVWFNLWVMLRNGTKAIVYVLVMMVRSMLKKHLENPFVNTNFEHVIN